MAIYRAETKHLTRSKKHNVVAAAAYRAGEKLTDTNKFNPNAATHDYSKKKGVLTAKIILPKELADQGFKIDRQTLWSSVEEHETTTRSVKGSRLKQSARLAREWLLALPEELSDKENEQLTAEFTQRLADSLGVIADYAIHKPTPYDKKKKKPNSEDNPPSDPDFRNIHAHIMFTTRKAIIDPSSGILTFGEKADSELSEACRKRKKLSSGGDYITKIRELWAELVNARLQAHKIPLVTHKSYKDLGIDIIPQKKQGKNATALSHYHFEPPILDINHDIKQHNREYIESAANRSIAQSDQLIESANRTLNQSQCSPTERKQRNKNAQRLIEQRTCAINRSNRSLERANQLIDRSNTNLSFDHAAADHRNKQLTDQQGQLNRSSAEEDWRTQHHRGTIETFNQRLQGTKRKYAYALIMRRNTTNAPKYDDRQHKQLKALVEANTSPDAPSIHDQADQLAAIFNDRFIADHIPIFKILRDPLAERQEYNRIKQEFDNFIKRLDKERDAKTKQALAHIGHKRKSSHSIANLSSSIGYIKSLDNYINDPNTPQQNKLLAQDHRQTSINLSCHQISAAYQDIKNIPTDAYSKHLDLLESSYHRFMNTFGNELTEKQQNIIGTGLTNNLSIVSNHASFRP